MLVKIPHSLPRCLVYVRTLLATDVYAMTYKRILGKSLCENVSDLNLGIDWKDLDKSTPDVFAKVVITHVDVLGTGT